MAQKLGFNLCKCLPALHHLTGSDYTSKVGTKHKALLGSPENYLLFFAQGIYCLNKYASFIYPLNHFNLFLDVSEAAICNSIYLAEKYLVQIMYKGNLCENFDQLRYWCYCKKMCDLTELPPTSKSMRLHILRSIYATRSQITILNANLEPLNPIFYGYIRSDTDDSIIPEKNSRIFPPVSELIPSCNCKKCADIRCLCFANKVECIRFCHCQSPLTCVNPFI